jgi:hypothetical protein
MDKIRKGDHVKVDGTNETMVASRDEYLNRVWVMSESEYQKQSASPNSPRGKEEPYLVLPDKTLVRDYQHGFPDEKG